MNKEFRLMVSECAKQQHNLDSTHDLAMRTALAAESSGWCDLHTREMHMAYQGKADEYWRIYALWFGERQVNTPEREIDDHVREARFYAFGRIAFLLIESLGAAVLAVMFFNAPWPLGAVIGVTLALLLGTAATSGVARWIRHDAAMQPAKQLARVSRGLVWFIIPWLIAVVTALAILRSDASKIGEALFLAATTAVTLLSPICCGLCAYAADLLFWSRRLCADLRWLRALSRRIEHLRTACSRCITPATFESVRVENRALRLIKSARPLLVICAAVTGALTCEVKAADLPIYLYADVSPSIRALDVHEVLKGISLGLEQYAGPNILVVSVIPFYQDAYSAAPILRIRIPSAATLPCDRTLSGAEMTRLSKTYAASAKKDADAQCTAVRGQAKAVALDQRRAEVAKLKSAIDHLSEIKLVGKCTAVNAMIRRAATETPTGIAVLISDLENDCPPYTLAMTSTTNNKVFIVPVGSRTRPVEAWFDSAQARFTQHFSGIRLLESFNLDIFFQVIEGSGH